MVVDLRRRRSDYFEQRFNFIFCFSSSLSLLKKVCYGRRRVLLKDGNFGIFYSNSLFCYLGFALSLQILNLWFRFVILLSRLCLKTVSFAFSLCFHTVCCCSAYFFFQTRWNSGGGVWWAQRQGSRGLSSSCPRLERRLAVEAEGGEKVKFESESLVFRVPMHLPSCSLDYGSAWCTFDPDVHHSTHPKIDCL